MPTRPTRDEYIQELETRIADLKRQLTTERGLHQQERASLEDKLHQLESQLTLVNGTVNELSSALQENKLAYEKQGENLLKVLEELQKDKAEQKEQTRRILLLLEGDEAGGIPGLCKTQNKHAEQLKSLENSRALLYALGGVVSFAYAFLQDKLKELIK